MSVIVTGMDIPKYCSDCSMRYYNMGCWITENGLDWENCDKIRLEDCPLKSIDGLIDKIIEQGDLYAIGGIAGGKLVKFGIQIAIKTIKEYCGENGEEE